MATNTPLLLFLISAFLQSDQLYLVQAAAIALPQDPTAADCAGDGPQLCYSNDLGVPNPQIIVHPNHEHQVQNTDITGSGKSSTNNNNQTASPIPAKESPVPNGMAVLTSANTPIPGGMITSSSLSAVSDSGSGQYSFSNNPGYSGYSLRTSTFPAGFGGISAAAPEGQQQEQQQSSQPSSALHKVGCFFHPLLNYIGLDSWSQPTADLESEEVLGPNKAVSKHPQEQRQSPNPTPSSSSSSSSSIPKDANDDCTPGMTREEARKPKAAPQPSTYQPRLQKRSHCKPTFDKPYADDYHSHSHSGGTNKPGSNSKKRQRPGRGSGQSPTLFRRDSGSRFEERQQRPSGLYPNLSLDEITATLSNIDWTHLEAVAADDDGHGRRGMGYEVQAEPIRGRNTARGNRTPPPPPPSTPHENREVKREYKNGYNGRHDESSKDNGNSGSGSVDWRKFEHDAAEEDKHGGGGVHIEPPSILYGGGNDMPRRDNGHGGGGGGGRRNDRRGSRQNAEHQRRDTDTDGAKSNGNSNNNRNTKSNRGPGNIDWDKLQQQAKDEDRSGHGGVHIEPPDVSKPGRPKNTNQGRKGQNKSTLKIRRVAAQRGADAEDEEKKPRPSKR